jgi:CheY-like chemotaxis protein
MSDTKVNLLIVDDEVSLRALLSHIFENRGYSVRSAEDGLTALFEIREQRPDIILSDLNMPGMSGYEFLKLVRLRLPEIPLIAMSSAFAGNAVPPGVVADAFYNKDADLSTLIRMVDAMAPMERQPSPPQPGALDAVWIPGNTPNAAGEVYVMVTCPECNKKFPLVLNEAMCRVEETSCIYCSSVIPYTITQSPDARPEQVPQRKQRKAAGTPPGVPGIH